ncbi:MAG: LCP family protein [Anaerolineae bacterium]|nr:LCP family protein [Anaerolineae bacterium]
MARRSRPATNDLSKYLVIGFIVLALLTGILGVILLVNLFSLAKAHPNTSVQKPSDQSNQVVEIPKIPEYKQSLQGADGPSPVQWNESGRVTVLVMGLDYRDWAEAQTEPSRTDSMILVTMDTQAKTAGMLSIPRDLWVDIPGFGEGKINTAYFNGEAYDLPGGGPGLAVATVQKFLGIPINYYAQIDFGAFVRFIDEIGGVDIHVKQDIVVDPLGPANTITLHEGVQTLDGATALAYARARDTEHGDFDRAERQQQVILAVRDNILNYYTLPKLVKQALPLYQQLSAGVKTNMDIYTALKLAWYAQQIPEKEIRRGIITEPEYATAMMSWDGQYALVPIPEQINALKAYVLGISAQPPVPTAETVSEASPSETVEQGAALENQAQQPTPDIVIDNNPQQVLADENARIVVLNGTTVAGLASRTGEYLRSTGLNVVGTGDAGDLYSSTEIRISAYKPETAKHLARIFNVPPSRVFNQGSSNTDERFDIVVIVGDDWANNNPIP